MDTPRPLQGFNNRAKDSCFWIADLTPDVCPRPLHPCPVRPAPSRARNARPDRARRLEFSLTLTPLASAHQPLVLSGHAASFTLY